MPDASASLYVDPPSPALLNDELFNLDNCRFNGDHYLAPYVSMRDQLTREGVTVHTVDRLPENSSNGRNLYVSIGNLSHYRALAGRSDVILSACLAVECPVVDPALYRGLKDAQRYFKRVLTWSDGEALEPFVGGPLKCERFHWPQSFDDVHEDIWRLSDRKFLVMMNANKIAHGSGELYSERLRAVEFFSRTQDIDLYGVGWDGPSINVSSSILPATLRGILHETRRRWQRIRPDPLLVAAKRVWHGPAKSKSETLGQYKFALCFENSILKGWVTEKIFDCLFTGTIPVYLGAPEITSHVPADCFIDMRRFSGYDELGNYLRSLDEEEISKFKRNARDYLRSDQFRPFSKTAFVDLFRRIVTEDAGTSMENTA
jgi:hypothetical protein